MRDPELRVRYDFRAIWPDDKDPFLNVRPAFLDGKIWQQNQPNTFELKAAFNNQ